MIDIVRLKEEAMASPKRRSRVILEPGFDMVICLHESSYVRMHRHPRYEAYHVMDGRLSVDYLHGENENSLFSLHYVGHPIVSIKPMTWHQPRATTEFAIYREFYSGPFEKARDVEYHPDYVAEPT